MRAEHDGRRPDVDGLRAIAAAAVLLFHFFPTAFPGGFVGVDVFFVISGYVVTLSIKREIDRGGFSFAGFYMRRVRRLYPSLIVVSVFCLAMSWAFHFKAEYYKTLEELVAAIFFVLNFLFARGPGYFDADAAESPLLHYWSLAVEEQFYFVWPLLLVLAARFGARRGKHVLIVLGLASLALHLALVNRWPIVDFYLLPTRVWEFAAGAYLAFRAAPVSTGRSWLSDALAAGALGLLGLCILVQGDVAGLPLTSSLIPVAAATLLISVPGSWLARALLASRPFLWFGVRSYPIYLWHWPPIVFYKVVYDEAPSPAIAALILVGAVVAAHFTYEWFERPVARARISLRKSAAVLAAGYVTVALVATLTRFGLSDERLVGARKFLEARQDWQSYGQVVLEGSSPQRVMLFGDSYMQQYFPRFDALLKEKSGNRLSVEFYANGGCAPFPGINRRSIPGCLEFVEAGFARAAGPDVRTVVIASSWVGFLRRGDYFDPATGRVLDLVSHDGEAVWQRFETEVARLVSGGKRVYIMLNPPGGKKANPVWLARHGTSDAKITLAEHTERVAAVNARLMAIGRATGAQMLDPASWLCGSDGACSTIANGEPIFSDSTHLRASYVRRHISALDFVTDAAL